VVTGVAGGLGTNSTRVPLTDGEFRREKREYVSRGDGGDAGHAIFLLSGDADGE